MKLNINKTVVSYNGARATVRFFGETDVLEKTKETYEKEIEEFIENKFSNDMKRNVSVIRTITRGIEEEILVISYNSKNSVESETVEYYKGTLQTYKKNKIIRENSEDIFSLNVDYNYGSKIDFKLTTFDGDIVDLDNVDLITETTKKNIELICALKNTKKLEIDINSGLLIEIYRLFYNENPDFKDKKINTRIQTMMYILSTYGINLNDEIYFVHTKMPVSLALTDIVNNLYPFGVIEETTNVKLSKEAKKTISIIGETIIDSIRDIENKERELITISNVMYAKERFVYDEDYEQISIRTGTNINKVEESCKLLKKIEKNYQNSNK